jgi:hypothetical protein
MFRFYICYLFKNVNEMEIVNKKKILKLTYEMIKIDIENK